MSTQLQYTFQIKLAELKYHALMKYQDYKNDNFILENFNLLLPNAVNIM